QRLVMPTGPFEIATSGRVRTAAAAARSPGAPYVPVPSLPDATLLYLIPSRFCESDRLGGLAREVIGNAAPGFDQVSTICDWVQASLRYLPESDPSPVSAAEVQRRGEGVCRDFAHLGIALCRSINIPARMVVGYVQDLEPMDLHAWFEAYVGNGWYTFDPTHPRLNTARVVVARGRDAADVPVFNQFGPPVTPSAMTVSVTARAET
ncbi:MAG: transglutaminase family protein, partial [Ectothiorhodospiraceae bacterium]